ncbi:DUF6817 domain-containing protein [Micromonospora sp. NPDC049230]|uniref:DUF6817 domain-containing protein n=1 Tax=Micromonospora sp. NPDC049230 TaxID=3155502 RepID=UPI0033D48B65
MSTDEDVRAWLRRQGAEQITHPGGNLYTHLCRVSQRLAVLGCGGDVQAAGLTHAVYGTDGFDLALLDWADRAVLRDLVNELDVIEQDPTVADRHGAYFRDVFVSWAPLASAQVIRDAQRVLRP